MDEKLGDDERYYYTVALIDDNNDDDHHLVHDQTSFFRTCFNCLNALSGIGLLSVPYALASGGWLSLIFLFIIAATTFYTGLLIKRCMDMDSSIRTYPDIGERAFGAKGRALVAMCMHLELYLVATGFLIAEGDNLHNLLPAFRIDFNGFILGGRTSLVIVVGLIILPTVWLKNMSILSYVSATGVIASVTLLVSVFWAATFDGTGFHHQGTRVNWNGVPTAVSLYAFCFCAHPVFPTLYSSMENKKRFSKVLQVCFITCTFGYAVMAILGYLMFGDDVSSQITLDLPTNNISSKVAICMTLVTPIAKYALMVTPIINAFENRFLSPHHDGKLVSLVIRTTLVISSIGVAFAIPFFGYLMSLVGAFLSITASVILPCLCFLNISGTYRTLGLELIILCGIVFVGVCILIVGTYIALLDIMRNL